MTNQLAAMPDLVVTPVDYAGSGELIYNIVERRRDDQRRVSQMVQPSDSGEMMFDHVVFGVSDYTTSKAFFVQALQPLGIAVVSEGPLGVELCGPNRGSSLCIRRRPEKKPMHLHLAFVAKNRQQVDAFYEAALGAGGKDNGAPGLRSQYHRHYYAAFVIGPDGHNIEAVCHEAQSS